MYGALFGNMLIVTGALAADSSTRTSLALASGAGGDPCTLLAGMDQETRGIGAVSVT